MEKADKKKSKISGSSYGAFFRELTVDKNNSSKETQDHSKSNQKLKTLNFSTNKVTSSGAEDIAKNENLTSLDMSFNLLKDYKGSVALLTNQNLKTLSLQTHIGSPEGRAIRANKNLHALHLVTCTFDAQGMAGVARNNTLRTLSMTATDDLGYEILKPFSGNSNLTSIDLAKSLDFSHNPEGIGKIFASMPSLITLGLSDCRINGSDLIKGIITSKSITDLNLDGNYINGEGVKLLATYPLLKKVNLINNGDVPITSDSISALAQSKSIEDLTLNGYYADRTCLTDLANNKNLKRVYFYYFPDYVGIIAKSQTISDLKLVASISKSISDESIEALVANTVLTSLDMYFASLTTQQMMQFAKMLLKKLCLGRNSTFDEQCASAYAQSSTLTDLDINTCNVNDAAFIKLLDAKQPLSQTLTALNITSNYGISPFGLTTAFSTNKKLTSLIFDNIPFGDMGAKILSSIPSSLTNLSLALSCISDRGGEALAKRTNSNLTCIDLSGNVLSSESAKLFATSPGKSLNLGLSGIAVGGLDGVKALANSDWLELNVSQNNLGDAGAAVFSGSSLSHGFFAAKEASSKNKHEKDMPKQRRLLSRL